MSYDIGEAFQRIEEEMIASMSRNLKRHLNTEEEEGLNYSMWQAEQLAALNNFRKDNKKTFSGYFSTINSQISEVLKKANESGKMDQEIKILEAIKDGFKIYDYTAAKSVRSQFFKINDRKMKALIKATTSDMAKAETAMLRMANDQYRKIIFNAGVYYNSGSGTLLQCVDMATKDFLASGISCIEYANGARVGIDSYSRMALRTAQTRAYLQGEATKRDEWGINTVIVNRRSVACPKCLQWVGKVYYDDVWGNSKIPNPPKYPLLSQAIAGGLYHPNCKDIHTTYFEGVSSKPVPMTKWQIEEANRVYAIEQKQRYYERKIRQYKRLAEGSISPENVLKYKEKLKEWETIQRDFVKANSDVLKRRPELEKIFDAPPTLQYGHNSYTQQNIESVASELLEKAKAAEPQITADLKEIVRGTNGALEGLDFRLKGYDSLKRKINSDILAGNNLKNVKNSLYDLVRYTSCSSSKNLINDYVATINELKAKGYKVCRVKNTLGKKDVAYRGINTIIETPGGYKFELQFHTPESLDIKEKVHKLYEKQRIDGISKEEYNRLDKEMKAMSNTIPDPVNVNAIKSFDTFKGENPIEVRLDSCKTKTYGKIFSDGF